VRTSIVRWSLVVCVGRPLESVCYKSDGFFEILEEIQKIDSLMCINLNAFLDYATTSHKNDVSFINLRVCSEQTRDSHQVHFEVMPYVV